MNCVMCDNPNYSWFEVLRDDCGTKSAVESRDSLCDVHQDIFVEQLKDAMELKNK